MKSPAILAILILLNALPSIGQEAWPAEPLSDAVNLTPIEGPGANDFHEDLSGAFWNATTRTLWLARNGPAGNSKLWAAVEDGQGGFEIDERAGARAEWTSFGDLEGVTQADLAEDVVYMIIEGEERVKSFDISDYGTATLLNDWDTASFLPRRGGSGAEGITFVPDAFLIQDGFVDGQGNPYVSTQGMSGLMFVGHQNGGGIFVFDLNRSNGSFVFVGEYETGQEDTSGLEFDRSTGVLYAYHDAGTDVLSAFGLGSSATNVGGRRALNLITSFDGPANENNEGIAIVSVSECSQDSRSFFLTTDDGEENSLRWYQSFEHGCEGSGVPVPFSGVTGRLILVLGGLLMGCLNFPRLSSRPTNRGQPLATHQPGDAERHQTSLCVTDDRRCGAARRRDLATR